MADERTASLRRRPQTRAARTRLSAVAHLASVIGHKARNRLALVRAGLELLVIGAEAALTPEHRAEILRQFDQFLGDFNLGLDLVRSDFGTPETGSLKAVIADAVEAYRPRAEAGGMAIRCEFAWSESDDTVELDRRLLRLVLLNLLRNAHEAGAASVGIRSRFRPGGARIELCDDGPGIPPPVAALIFREAVTTRSDGTGVGLLLCRDAMAAMGGSIRLGRSKVGARFVLTLPARAEPGL